jgi:hypothetical protein
MGDDPFLERVAGAGDDDRQDALVAVAIELGPGPPNGT